MNLFRKAVIAATLVFLISRLFSCVSSSLVNLWHDPSFQAPPLSRMLVIAARKDATKRRLWEDAFNGELAKHGVAATSSYHLFPDAPPDTNQVITTVQENGFDGILVVLRLPTEMHTQHIQGYTTTERDMRFNPYYGPYWQRYWVYYREVEHPVYTDSQKVAIHEIDVTTTGNGGHLIWSATSRTPDPGSVTDIQRGIAGLVMSELAKQSIIRPKN